MRDGGQRRPRRRDPGYASALQVDAALAPFYRPPARMPHDTPGSFVIRELGSGDTRHGQLEFTPAARTKLLKHFSGGDNRVEEAIEWLTDELKWPYLEEHGYARRHTYHQLLTALRTLARLDPALRLPVLPPAFLRAVMSSERRRRAGTLMRTGIYRGCETSRMARMRCAKRG